MKRSVAIYGGSVTIATSIDMEFPASLDRLHIYSGPFVLMGLGDPEARKALIAALVEADKELDAAAEARKGRVA